MVDTYQKENKTKVKAHTVSAAHATRPRYFRPLASKAHALGFGFKSKYDWVWFRMIDTYQKSLGKCLAHGLSIH
jgi:hypothetical protein